MAALRFAIEGSSTLSTIVNGEDCAMEPYDLVLTPAWHWHDHRNGGDRPAVWLDVLDVPLVTALNHLFYEPFGEERQPVLNRAGELTGRMAPPAQVMSAARLPRLRFPWREVEPLLREAGCQRASPYDGVLLDYLQPDGGPVLPSLGCSIQLLRPGEETATHRHSSSAVYFVLRGEGTTVIGERRLEWNRHDCFVLPNWAPHAHVNRSSQDDAVLFSVTDIPLLRYLGLYREEPELSIRRAFPTTSRLVEPAFLS
jgi:1-hydroxy-2-naphthoate dioxygenase